MNTNSNARELGFNVSFRVRSTTAHSEAARLEIAEQIASSVNSVSDRFPDLIRIGVTLTSIGKEDNEWFLIPTSVVTKSDLSLLQCHRLTSELQEYIASIVPKIPAIAEFDDVRPAITFVGDKAAE